MSSSRKAAAAAAAAAAASTPAAPTPSFVIRDVWKETLEREFALLRSFAKTHPIVSMDVEYPGIVVRSIENVQPLANFLYNNVRFNVDVLNPIQISFSLATLDGALPVVDGVEVGAWQFNLKFSTEEDMFSVDSLELLARAGVKLEHLAQHGVDHLEFGELLISSGLVLMDDLTFITFQGGFAAAYLLKLTTGKSMPVTLDKFCEELRLYVPTLYDLRTMIQKSTQNKWSGGGLEALAKEFGVAPLPPPYAPHTAGADSYLALKTYFAMLQSKGTNVIDPVHAGLLFGLEPKSSGASPVNNMGTGSSGIPPLTLTSGGGGEARHLKRRGTSDMFSAA